MHTAIDRLTDVGIDAESGLHIGTITIDGQRLRVGIRPGTPGAVPRLLFNGIGANLELAGLLISHLDGVETVIFDVPGAGKSPATKFPYCLAWLARLSRKLMKTLGYTGQMDVMGVSWGGGLAQQFAIQYPRTVRRLVLAATSMGGPTMVPGRPSVLLKMINPRRYLDKGYMQSIAPDLYGGDLRRDAQAVKLFTQHAKGGDPTGYKYQLLAMAGWTSLPWLWRIKQPTLVLAGSDDPLVPLINARLHAWLLPNAQLHVFDDGHLFMLTQARETATLISGFLAQERPRAAKRAKAKTAPAH